MSNKLIKSSSRSKKPMYLSIYHWLQRLLNIIICAYMVFIIVVIPYYNKFTYKGIGTGKVNLFIDTSFIFAKIIIPLIAFYMFFYFYVNFRKQSAGVRQITNKSIISFSITDKLMIIYIISVIISFMFSDFREEAFVGADGWGMGLFTQLTLACSYFLISRLWKKNILFPLLFIPATAILFILSYLNRFGIYPINMGSLDPQFLSFVGNINWFCGYMVMPIFGCVCFIWCGRLTNHYLQYALNIYLFISFSALITNGSSSGILTTVCIFFLLFLMSVKDAKRFLSYRNLLVIFSASCIFTLLVRLVFPDAITYHESVTEILTFSVMPGVLIFISLTLYLVSRKWNKQNTYPKTFWSILAKSVFIGLVIIFTVFIALIVLNTLNPGFLGSLSKISLFTFNSEWGSRRGATWTAGWMAWLEQPLLKKLIGVGPDCMKSYIYMDGSEKLLNFCHSVWPNHTLTNAHNELLTLLVNTGILGAISYAGILASSIVRYLRRLPIDCSLEIKIAASCGLGIAAYAIHNTVSFQQVLNTPTMFLLLGIGEAYYRNRLGTAK